ncbi:unnamed protein product [Pipistrellus nathusii]|uniref:Uncharacterized protein n=1 Tax=Pipistrellus nathusii TaxID=59473 RepID=A0ABN9ZEB3_PIPNA
MRPLGSIGVAELREPGLPLTEDTTPSTSEDAQAVREEPAEAVETPGPSWCWLCRSSPCGSRAQPERGRETHGEKRGCERETLIDCLQ